MVYAITDIETTGSFASGNSITEVAVILTDGHRELDRWTSLIRPEGAIPDYITALTGIDNHMTAEAPTFAEVAEELHAFLEGRVFVAHNVHFDYSFIRKHLDLCGIRWNPRKLCTVRLSRKIIPGLPSYSLGRLCESLDISNHARHRAMGDTQATFELFKLLVQKDGSDTIGQALRRGSGEAFLPNHVNAESFHTLPELPGVYYFLDNKGQTIYIGKAKNIKKRVRSHFSGNMKSKRKQAFVADIHDIQYRLTGTELIALLVEDAEIRKYWPTHNRAQKARALAFGVFAYTDQSGLLRLGIHKRTGSGKPLRTFHSLFQARAWLYQLAEDEDIHPHLFNLPTFTPFEGVDSDGHNDLMHALLVRESQNFGSLLIKGEGRTLDEQSLVWIQDGVLRGIAYLEHDERFERPEDLEDRLEALPSSETTTSVLRSYLEKARMSELVHLTAHPSV